MAQADVRLDLLPSYVHCREDVVGVEDEHPAFFISTRDELSAIFDEATVVVEVYLHSLFYYLAD
jgi:hypothetical protein